MKTMTATNVSQINAGARIYQCIKPGCSKKSTSFATVYAHCLSSGHFKANKALKALYDAGMSCWSLALKLL